MQSEIFLRQILQNVPLQELQSRVQPPGHDSCGYACVRAEEQLKSVERWHTDATARSLSNALSSVMSVIVDFFPDRLSLDMARFPLKAADLESGPLPRVVVRWIPLVPRTDVPATNRLDLALTAAWSIIDSRAVPILLEGILLLGPPVSCAKDDWIKTFGEALCRGNSVNASSKNLGGAVGVTLDSLTKLAHTRCLPAKQARTFGLPWARLSFATLRGRKQGQEDFLPQRGCMTLTIGCFLERVRMRRTLTGPVGLRNRRKLLS